MSTSETLTINSDLEPTQAAEACGSYARELAGGREMTIEFDKADPNIFALQFALACRRSLAQDGRFAGFGPLAQVHLGNLLTQDTPSET